MSYPDNPFIGQTWPVGSTTKQCVGLLPDGRGIWKNITNGNHELRLQFAEKSAALMTLAEAQASDLKVGQYVVLTDFGGGLFKVTTGEVANNIDIHPLGDKQLKLVVYNGELKLDWLPLIDVADESGTKFDNAPILNRAVQLAQYGRIRNNRFYK